MPAFAMAGIFVKIYNVSDSILLSYLDSDRAVGFYAIPAKTVYSLQQIIPAAFAAAIFPVFSSNYQTSTGQLNNVFQRAFSYIIVISLPLTAGLLILLPQIVRLVWPTYTAVVPTFRVMTASMPFLFLAFPTGYLLNACDRQKNTTINRGIMTLVAVTLNIILIPLFSFLGAGITFLVASVLVLILDWFWIKKIITINKPALYKIIGKALLATLIMAAVIYILQSKLHLLIIIPLAALVYFGTLLLLKGVSVREAREIFKTMR
jgi:O-antigen/teichoic acid export membrane protein